MADTVPSPLSAFYLTEQKMIEYWKEHKIFERSVSERPVDKTWNFLDGPPFVTGTPHYGHIIGSILKDVFPRFKTMQGYRVRRVWGWDCHGLPAENKVENALGLKSKREIETKVGVKKFIEECKIYVHDVSSEWEWYIDHIGRWVDIEHAYRTMDRDYMESVMWVFKQMYEKDFIYKGLRVSLYCPHCATPISNFEVAMDANENYKDLTEPANTYKYKVVGSENTYFLAWSTTPWTKLTTTALCVNPELIYVKFAYQGEYYIVAESTLAHIPGVKDQLDTLKIEQKWAGLDLVGQQYEGHYDFYDKEPDKKLHVIVADPYVTAGEGTGIVTLAPYGEDDMRVMERENVQIVTDIDEEGKLSPNNPPAWVGMYYLKVNKLVNEDLTARGLMFHEEANHTHTIPHCWRCHTRLFYNPQSAWYVDIARLKPLMATTNESVNWYPSHFKHGRFLKSMESAPDWCISRSRYWGSPVPVWECDACDKRYVPGSIAELEKMSGGKIADLHKPEIDEVTIPCDCGGVAHRVPEVLDSWIEAGSASFAERHFPFDATQKLDEFFPPDYISEYTGQIRAWFYVLHVIAAALYERPAFKHVLVSGVILGTDGRKMSKNYKNYPDPRLVIEKYGGDALRLYLLGSPITDAQDISFSETDYRDQLRKFILPLLNIYNFYATYAAIDGYDVKSKSGDTSQNVLDMWITSRLHTTVKEMTEAYENFDTMRAVASSTALIDDWSRWYLRRSRDRVGDGELTDDVRAFYETTHNLFEIFLRLVAPLTPFHSEYLYRLITDADSVHLMSWPESDAAHIHLDLDKAVVAARQICEVGHQIRKTNGQKVRQPLASLSVTVDADCSVILDNVWQLVLDELNVKNVVVNDKFHYPHETVVVTPEELEREMQLRDLAREIQEMRKSQGVGVGDKISLTLPEGQMTFAPDLKRLVKASQIVQGEVLSLTKA